MSELGPFIPYFNQIYHSPKKCLHGRFLMFSYSQADEFDVDYLIYRAPDFEF